MELIELNVKTRQEKGKGHARFIRKNGAVPAVLYGGQTEPVMLSVETPDLTKLLRESSSSSIFLNLAVKGDEKAKRTVLLKEIQMDTFNTEYLHVDFQEVDLDAKITVSVLVEAVGESIGVKEGGVLQIIRRELDVICKPTDMPESIAIDITELEVGDVVHVEEIELGSDIELPHDVNFTVLTVVPPTTKEEEEVAEEDEDFELAEGEEAGAEAEAEAEPES